MYRAIQQYMVLYMLEGVKYIIFLLLGSWYLGLGGIVLMYPSSLSNEGEQDLPIAFLRNLLMLASPLPRSSSLRLVISSISA